MLETIYLRLKEIEVGLESVKKDKLSYVYHPHNLARRELILEEILSQFEHYSDSELHNCLDLLIVKIREYYCKNYVQKPFTKRVVYNTRVTNNELKLVREMMHIITMLGFSDLNLDLVWTNFYYDENFIDNKLKVITECLIQLEKHMIINVGKHNTSSEYFINLSVTRFYQAKSSAISERIKDLHDSMKIKS